jgi:hypothetical protein
LRPSIVQGQPLASQVLREQMKSGLVDSVVEWPYLHFLLMGPISLLSVFSHEATFPFMKATKLQTPSQSPSALLPFLGPWDTAHLCLIPKHRDRPHLCLIHTIPRSKA